MKIIRDLAELQPNMTDGAEYSAEYSVALGNFDGLHKGHLSVLEAAKSKGYPLAVFTFWQNPHEGSFLITREEKAEIFASLGVELLVSVDFNDVRSMSALSFFEEVLVKKLRAKNLACGEDFRFGERAQGNVSLLRELCKQQSIELEVVRPVLYQGERISSTRIREALETGELRTANEMLGREFGFSLEVIHGNHIGTGLGMPTINQNLPNGFILPKFGVYASFVLVEGKLQFGVTNIGVKPTVGSERVLSETWMPDFSGDLYGKKLRIYLIDFIRAERKFSSLEEMKAEVMKNAEEARRIAADYKWISEESPLANESGK